MGIINALLVWAVALAIAGWGTFFAAYYRKKGENLATHEDLDKLIKQVKATTEATARIEARISDEVWNKQKHWELKRDTVVSVIQSMDAAKDALMRYAARRVSVKEAAVDPNRFETVMEASNIWNERAAEFDTKRAMTALICSKELNDALWKVQQAIRGGYSDLFNARIASYDDIGADVRDRIIHAITAARNELGIPEVEAIPQSGASSS